MAAWQASSSVGRNDVRKGNWHPCQAHAWSRGTCCDRKLAPYCPFCVCLPLLCFSTSFSRLVQSYAFSGIIGWLWGRVKQFLDWRCWSSCFFVLHQYLLLVVVVPWSLGNVRCKVPVQIVCNHYNVRNSQVELKTGETYRGELSEAEDNWNCQIKNVSATAKVSPVLIAIFNYWVIA